MFDIERVAPDRVRLAGRLDAARAPEADALFDTIDGPCLVDFTELRYISSAGLGVLLKTQKRLMDAGHALRLTGLSPHLGEIFRFAGFDRIFEIE